MFDANIIGNYGYAPLEVPATNPETNHAAYHGVLNLVAGDKIDFTVSYGGNGYAGDLTGLDITITEVPEPGSMLALGAVLASLAGWRRRRA